MSTSLMEHTERAERKRAAHVPTEDYYCAQRDSDGNVRLNCGRGALVARADDSIDTVRGWFQRSEPGRFREQYRSALRLMLDEAYDEAGIPRVVD